jgi:hypothetical protein
VATRLAAYPFLKEPDVAVEGSYEYPSMDELKVHLPDRFPCFTKSRM